MSALIGIYSGVTAYYDITKQKGNKFNKYLCCVCDVTGSNCCGFVVFAVSG